MDQSYLRIMMRVSYQLQPYITQSEAQLLQIRFFYILENKSKVDILGLILSLVTFGRYLMAIGDRKRLIYYCFFCIEKQFFNPKLAVWTFEIVPNILRRNWFWGKFDYQIWYHWYDFIKSIAKLLKICVLVGFPSKNYDSDFSLALLWLMTL